ncbi:class I SAM-dependent methyltransferase [uncultured Piscinibacter sp.]|uniref:class I SAM-dependent methyltransferase n=1 Tax=uncultured Piscinibacter sp. TaxID=1131835 RepID=UPI0026230F8B|nr:class I SAM-dependent methyltransferase [uncultured Piscinibacter sp.]
MSDDIDRNAFRDFERSAHDRLASTYHAFFAPVTERAAGPLLTKANVGARTQVLDAACGSGVIARHAALLGAIVTGVDLSPRMIELAARLNPGCTFREASVDSMLFDDGAFDAVVCAFGIGHFPDPPVAVAECARVLRDGRICALAWWDLPARNRLHGVLMAALEEINPVAPPDLPAGPPLFRYSEDDAFRGLLESAGLRDVGVASHTFEWRLPDAQALWSGSLGCMARNSALICAQLPETRARIQAAFIRHANQYLAEDGLSLPMAFKVCAGRKPAFR